MKIIDILVTKANGTLEDGFKFKCDDVIYSIEKDTGYFIDEQGCYFTERFEIENILNEEVEVIEENKGITPLMKLKTYNLETGKEELLINQNIEYTINKVNQVIEVLNKLTKE